MNSFVKSLVEKSKVLIAVQVDQQKFVEENCNTWTKEGTGWIEAVNLDTNNLQKYAVIYYKVSLSLINSGGVPGGYWLYMGSKSVNGEIVKSGGFWKRTNYSGKNNGG